MEINLRPRTLITICGLTLDAVFSFIYDARVLLCPYPTTAIHLFKDGEEKSRVERRAFGTVHCIRSRCPGATVSYSLPPTMESGEENADETPEVPHYDLSTKDGMWCWLAGTFAPV